MVGAVLHLKAESSLDFTHTPHCGAWVPMNDKYPLDFSLATAKVAYITAMIFLQIILHSAVHI